MYTNNCQLTYFLLLLFVNYKLTCKPIFAKMKFFDDITWTGKQGALVVQ